MKNTNTFFYKSVIFLILTVSLIIFLFPTRIYAASLDNVFKSADDFVSKGESRTVDDQIQLKKASNYIYNALLAISMIMLVIVGIILGMKYMTSSLEDKADVKETLVPYLITASVIFGAFTIWKIIINIIQ